MSRPEFCNHVKTMDERFVPLLCVPANSRFSPQPEEKERNISWLMW